MQRTTIQDIRDVCERIRVTFGVDIDPDPIIVYKHVAGRPFETLGEAEKHLLGMEEGMQIMVREKKSPFPVLPEKDPEGAEPR